jgi:hypothetical protein
LRVTQRRYGSLELIRGTRSTTLSAMSKTALVNAINEFDLPAVQRILKVRPELKNVRLGNGLNLLQFCSKRSTAGNAVAARRQLRLAQWLVRQGFDPTTTYTTAPGEDGEEQAAELSLTFFAVAKAQNDQLARYYLGLGANPNAMFAAVWWGNADIIEDLVTYGADINEVVGATPLHAAVDLLHRGTTRAPALARRRMQTLRELLRLGANPNIAAVNGSTPLHTVLEKSYDVSVFTLLLQHGANPDLPGKDGRSVRDIAARKRDTRYARALARFFESASRNTDPQVESPP